MMKFNSYYDLHPKKDTLRAEEQYKFSAQAIPTVDEVDNTLSFMYADTVLQILRGQGLYFGYECERFCENEIPSIKDKYNSDYRTTLLKNQMITLIKKTRKVTRAQATMIFLNTK